MKFEYKELTSGYTLYPQYEDHLISFGKNGQIVLVKNGASKTSHCRQGNMICDYHGIKKALIGKIKEFIVKRIVVFEMI